MEHCEKKTVKKNTTKAESKHSLNKMKQCWKRCNFKHLESQFLLFPLSLFEVLFTHLLF